MRLKKLEIEGFKSYANKVTITDFDNSFNAITGYNGTGKSNVLDAICFVLGISNIKQVRAQHLADLIYKQGQAGISKASVTATFDHSNKDHKVPGYELGKDIVVRRQIVLNGRNTYTVNGAAATNNKVADLFRSVGMNVNNPHFLIMQGRIGKVLNMNPKEILAMVEEAVGVRIYEAKKTTCLRTIEKKDVKLKEIVTILDEQIAPMMGKLTTERESFLKFERLKVEVQNLQKKLLAYEYMKAEEGINRYLEQASEKEKLIDDISKDINEANLRIKELKTEVDELTKTKDKASAAEKSAIDGRLKGLQAEKVKAESAVDEAKKEIKREENELKSMITGKSKSEKELEKMKLNLESVESSIGDDVKNMEQAQADLDAAQKAQTAAQRNMITDENGDEVFINDLKIRYNSQITSAKTENANAKQRLAKLDQEIKNLEREINSKKDMDAERLNKEKEDLSKQVETIKKNLSSLNFDEQREMEINREMQKANMEVSKSKQTCDRFFDCNPYYRFEYRHPPNSVPFDPNDICGQVFQLFTIKDRRFHRAIEIAASGTLPQVVTRTGSVAQVLLDNRCLAQRTTFIPLDAIRGDWVRQDVINRAREMCKGEVYSIAELIQYDPKFEVAMRYVFGNRLICMDTDDASKIAFDLKTRAITLIGEDVNPGGTASGGGSSGNSTDSKLMNDIENYNVSRKQLADNEQVLQDLQRTQRQLQEKSRQVRDFRESMTAAKERLEVVERQLKQSTVQVLLDELMTLKTEKEQKMALVQEHSVKIPELDKKLKEIEANMKNQEAFIERKLKEARQLEADAKRRLNQYNAASKKDQLDRLRDDITSRQESIEQTVKEIEEKTQQIEDLKTQLNEHRSTLEDVNKNVEAEQAVLNDCLSKLDAQEQEIREKNADISAIKKQVMELDSKKEQVGKEVDADRQKSKDAKQKVNQMESKNPYLKHDKKYFNTPNSDYDFSNFHYNDSREKCEQKREEMDSISQNINPDAGSLLEKNEEQATDLMNKRKVLEEDKKQLLATIKNLDEKKRQEMKAAYNKVNESFGSIFSTLLPNAQAKLVPTAGATIDNLDPGLEFKIGFSNMWKDSLSELSGGQKSLVALSLILSLLRFKPAPLYILDEIDAALDISHTANIGALIKKHFSAAQFIIVSLKPGMFKNANAIFRTKLQDGVSSIARVHDDIEENFDVDQPPQC